ncbi:olee1-like protein [Malania oleifera]|uniref:olee1-like protein n=1 Tax=Malania oleifera TaxID=397392 RepID=UPI0025AE298B|nr:olee1-like protein [Malania oleifera]
MAKSAQAAILLATALCFLSLASVAHSFFLVEGQVYCDTCRAKFQTRASEPIKGSKVRLECRDREGGHLTYTVEGETDAKGMYHLEAEGNHEEEVCEVVLVKSGSEDCKEENKVGFGRHSARISLTHNNGISSPSRLANPLFFMRKEALPVCPEVLRELGILPAEIFH